MAALDALRTLEGELEVFSDSTYVVNCFRDRWWEGWLKRGWTNSKKEPVANRDLWEPLVSLYRADPSRVRFTWVKGHGGDAMNDLVDRLAVAATTSQQGGEGDSPPTELGPADSVGRAASGPGSASGADGDGPAGFRVVAGGLRPPGLGGYDPNPVADDVRRRLTEILAAQRQLHPDLVLLSGMGLGAEQLGVEAAVEAGVPFVPVLPYPDPDKVWPEASRRRFRSLVNGGRETVVVSREAPSSKQKAGAALARRDQWLARHADAALVVWDHEDPTIGRLVRSLTDHVGEEDVWIVEPKP